MILCSLLVKEASLSATSLQLLTTQWRQEDEASTERRPDDRKVVYVWPVGCA
jgi:hypothetical protein